MNDESKSVSNHVCTEQIYVGFCSFVEIFYHVIKIITFYWTMFFHSQNSRPRQAGDKDKINTCFIFEITFIAIIYPDSG